jgi:uncharacterized protein YggE
MKKLWFLVIGIVLLAPLVFSACSPTPATGGSNSGQQERILVTGTGKMSAVPDVATLGVGIEAQETTVAQAQSEASQAMNNVTTALKTNGVADTDIQNRQYSIDQVTQWDSEKQENIVLGYRVTNIVNAKIRAMDKIGTIIDAVTVAGGDLTRINGLAFSIDDPTPFQQQARAKAVPDAQAKASQLAQLAGVTLGKPTYISESVQVPTPIYSQAVGMAEAIPPTPISPGEMEISVSVQITYAIAQ